MSSLQDGGDEVIGAGAADGFENRLEPMGIRFVRLPVPFRSINPFADMWLFWNFFLMYRRERPEVVHHFTIKPVIYGSIAARLAGVPRIVNTVTGLGYVFSDDASSWLRKLVELQYRVALGCSHFTFFQNADDQLLFTQRRLTTNDKSGLLPGSGVNTDKFSPRTSDSHKVYIDKVDIDKVDTDKVDTDKVDIDKVDTDKVDTDKVDTDKVDTDKVIERVSTGAVVFLMMARLLKDKGVYEFIEAAKRVKQEHPNARFQLLGKRDEHNPAVVPLADLQNWQQAGVIEYLGEVDDVRDIVSESDVFVLPSYYREGTPRSLLEAAAMGKPIITTDNVGCRDVVDHGVNGFLVPVKNAVALADAMICMLQDEDRRTKMGLAGRKKIVREFDEQLVIQRCIAAYSGKRVQLATAVAESAGEA